MIPQFRSARPFGVVLLLLIAALPANADDAGGLTLREAIEAALARNPQLAAFAFELQAQDARYQQAALRPALEASVEAENIFGTGETEGTDQAEITLSLSSVIELGDKRRGRIDAADATRAVLDVEQQARQLDVLAEVTRRFVDVASAQQRLQLAKRGSELAAQTVAGAERRVQAAKSPHVELDRAHIAQDRARLEERRAAVDLDAARRQLAATWGEPDATIAGRPIGEARGDLFAMPQRASFATLLGRLAANPDFLRFASEARLRDAELRLAATLRKSNLTVAAGVRRLEETNDEAFVASFSLPLSTGSRAESFVAEARANRERVDAERHAAETRAQATLYELSRQLEQAALEVQTLKDDMLPRVEEALTETGYAYERGRYSYLELVDAQREYLAVQEGLIAAASDAHKLQTEIERLTNAPIGSVSSNDKDEQ